MGDDQTFVDHEQLAKLIQRIRHQNVILDSDIARLYEVPTKALLQAVKRNKIRFPEDFLFQLTPPEFESLRSQIVTSKGRGGRRTPPYAFTEQRYDGEFRVVFRILRKLIGDEPKTKRSIGFRVSNECEGELP
jgi:hypothetical protein